METKAAVLYEPNTSMVIETLDLQESQEDESRTKKNSREITNASTYHRSPQFRHGRVKGRRVS